MGHKSDRWSEERGVATRGKKLWEIEADETEQEVRHYLKDPGEAVEEGAPGEVEEAPRPAAVPTAESGGQTLGRLSEFWTARN